MAKGTTVGFLNFGIDGDNKELMKKLEQAKKEAISVQQIMQDIMRSRSQATNTQTGNESRRNALNQARIQEIQTRSLERQRIQQEQLAREVLRTESLRQRMNSQSTASQNSLTNAIGLTNKTMFSQRNLLMQMSQALGIYFSIYQVGAFVKELANVSGEFEKQRASLAAILQDTDAATKIFNQVKELAVISPFNFKELTDYAKQLSAFSIPTNEIFDTMKRLADVSAGLGVDMNRIILAYGQVRSASVLRGQELRQFTEAGIPLVDELAKKFGELEGRVVSAGDVFDKISNRQVPFEMIKDIFTDLTSEGGKFYQMQEVQSATLAGKISNLRDNYDMMLDSIGQANSGLLHGSVDAMVSLMDNWKSFSNILLGVISAYGAYKAAVIFSTAVQGKENSVMLKSIMSAKAKEASMLSQASIYRTLTAQEQIRIITSNKLTSADLRQLATSGALNKESALRLIATRQITVAQAGHLKGILGITRAEIAQSAAVTASGRAWLFMGGAIKGLGASLKALALNPYTWVIAAIGGIVYALSEWNDKQKEIDDAAKRISDSVSESYKSIASAISKLKPDIELSLAPTASDKEISQTVQKLRNALSDIVPEDIFSNIIKQLDGIPDGTKQVEFLSNTFKDLQKWAELASKDIESVSDNALSATDGLFDENLLTNIKDYGKSLKEYNDILSYLKKTNQDNNTENTFLKRATGIKDKDYAVMEEDLKTYFQFIKDTYFKNIQDWSKDPKLSYGSQLLVSEFRDKLLQDIDGISPAVSEEITSLFNKTFYISPKIELDAKAPSTFQLAVEQAYSQAFGTMGDMTKVTKTSVMPQDGEKAADWLSRMSGLYSDAKDQLKLYNEALLANKTIFDPATLEFLKKQVSDIPTLLKNMGMSIPQPKSSSTEKDTLLDSVKKRIDNLKSAKSEYDKLIKEMSVDDATKALSNTKSFAGIDASKLGDAEYEKAIESYISELEKGGKKLSKARLDFIDQLNLDLDKTKISNLLDETKKKSEKAIKQIEKSLSQYKDKYSLYQTLFGMTGDKGQSARLAFGDISGEVQSFRNRLKDELDNTTDPELKQKLSDQLTDLDFSETADFSKRMADLVKEYQSVDEQLTTIRYKGEATRLEILKNADNATQDVVDQRIKANQEATNKQISDLTNGVLQATESYQRLFGEIGEISNKELQLLINRWKDALNNATKDGNGMKKVSIDGKEFTTTEKEIASFTKRVLKSETELRSRNPFKALKDNLDELSRDRSKIQQLKSDIESLKGALASAEQNQANGDNTGLSANNIKNIKQQIADMTTQLEGMQGKSATSLQKVGVSISAIGSVAQSVASDLAGMFEALGKESMADTIGFIGEMTGALSNIGAGIASGNPVQVIQGIIGGITSIANFHDKKLDRAIQKSQLEVKKLQGSYEQMERFISRQLGAVTEKQAKEQIKNLKAQQAELQKQMDAENKKKKTDKSAIQDYKNSISELQDQIKYFYEDLLDEEYGLNLKSIADELSSSLVDAFKNGENAAKSFDSTVADIINNLAQKMIAMQVIEPAMQKIRDYLFGDNGVFNDGELSVNDASGLVGLMGGLKDKIGESQAIWDALNEAAKKVGIDLGQTSVKDTLSKGIQSITEDTANLLASYLNAIRADVAATRQIITQLIQISQTNSNTFALQLAELVKIQVNTFNTANNTAQIASTAQATYDLLKSATVPSGGTKFNMA